MERAQTRVDYMRSTLASSVIVAIISAGSAHALESSVTARSSLSPDELWSEVAGFCAISAWDPVVERCELSADGKQRTIVIFGGVGRVVAELENRDDANRSYSWRANVSGLLPVENYRGSVSVAADGQASTLKWTASYEAKGVSDPEAQKIIDDAIRRALCFPESEVSQSYSITSSARASSEGGTVRPSALAVLRLMINSNLVGC
jgi:hypothetical protein